MEDQRVYVAERLDLEALQAGSNAFRARAIRACAEVVRAAPAFGDAAGAKAVLSESVSAHMMARITAIIPMRRGQILGFEPRDGWFGWDSIRAYLPEDELHDLIIEVRSATQGLGEFVFAFDHMAEVTGKW